jgi:hypothetical protein
VKSAILNDGRKELHMVELQVKPHVVAGTPDQYTDRQSLLRKMAKCFQKKEEFVKNSDERIRQAVVHDLLCLAEDPWSWGMKRRAIYSLNDLQVHLEGKSEEADRMMSEILAVFTKEIC